MKKSKKLQCKIDKLVDELLKLDDSDLHYNARSYDASNNTKKKPVSCTQVQTWNVNIDNTKKAM